MFGKKGEEPKKGELTVNAEKALINTQTIRDIINETRDPRDLALMETGKMMWDKDKLNMVGRHDRTMMYYLIKNFIVINFYQKFWENITYEYEIGVDAKTGEHTHKMLDYTHPYDTKMMEGEYLRILLTVQEMLIGLDGKSREEIVTILRAGVDRVGAFAERLNTEIKRGI
jgi:hypothetical protein